MNTDNIKTPLTRLLDMTAGWADFVQKDDAGVVDPAVSADELCELYQGAGQIMAEEMSPAEESRQVRRFVEDRVLPLLMREVTVTQSTRSSVEKTAASVPA